ncbi:hypothetical protein GOV10_01075 [Candidatus Woesearchaeota archaeon]|nr:hypothetical protein [Candidatus Woesearchaeota archaeon]
MSDSVDKIVLFEIEGCPFCAKVKQHLEKKGLPFEEVVVAPWRDDPLRKELFEKSGIGTTPVIKDGDLYIGDSQAIIDHLENVYK